jgi:hypothetical protein
MVGRKIITTPANPAITVSTIGPCLLASCKPPMTKVPPIKKAATHTPLM